MAGWNNIPNFDQNLMDEQAMLMSGVDPSVVKAARFAQAAQMGPPSSLKAPPPGGDQGANFMSAISGVGRPASDWSAVPPQAGLPPGVRPVANVAQVGNGGLGLDGPPSKAPATGGAPTAAAGNRSAGAKPFGNISNDDYDTLVNALNQKGLDSIDAQKQGVDGMESDLDKLKRKGFKTNYAPLLALADSWNGSHTADAYKAPENEETRAATIQKLQQAIQQSKGAISQDDMSLLKTRLDNETRKQGMAQHSADLAAQLQMHREQLASQSADRKESRDARLSQQDTQHLFQAQDRLNKDKAVVDATTRLDDVASARKELAGALANPSMKNQIPIIMARLAVNGRLNETELKAFGGSSALKDKADALWTSMDTGGITPKNQADLMAIVDNYEKGAKSSISRQAEHHVTQYARATGKNMDDARYDLLGTLGQDAVTAGAAVAPPKVGDIVEGHKFLGGDPSQPASWGKL